jgi:TolB-like protein/Tfp pilus assembly protein PilF/DNA-binding winged helix-turn-helix (wHTH) protein
VASGPSKISGSVKLGENYELDFGAYELRRSGRPIKLERIPMELLLLLVEQRGQLVGRNQILTRIWGDDVCLDADNSINAAVRKLRQALRDDPEHPRYIQTVTGKGYRFVAAVSDQATPAIQPPVAPLPAPPIVSPDTLQPEETRGDDHRNARIKKHHVIAGFVVFLVAVGAYSLWSLYRARSSQAPSRVMVAVLPFENLTGDPTQEYFSDGLTEEMISQLGNLDPRSFGVIARTSVMHYKGTTEPLDQIARKLHVQYVLEGSVRRDPEKMRITVQLISTNDQTHLWARNYDREVRDLLILQDEIAREVAAEIQGTLGKSGQTPKPAVQSSLSQQQSQAHDFYLRGQYFWNKRTADGLKQAKVYFQQATEKDPNYAPAYVGLAEVYALLSGYDSSIPSREVMPQARENALRALELDPSLPDAHTAMAVIAQDYDWDWQTAEREYRRAIELNDNNATAHHWYGEYLAFQGRFDEALREIDRALLLDPLSLIIATDRGVILYYARHNDRALEQFRSIFDRDPNFPRAHAILGVYVEKGLFKEAFADLERWQRSMPDSVWAWAQYAYIYGRAGESARAGHGLEKLKQLDRKQPIDPALFFVAYIGMGNKDEAFRWLEKAYDAHSASLVSLKADPTYDPVRSDPRFQAMLRRLRFAQDVGTGPPSDTVKKP